MITKGISNNIKSGLAIQQCIAESSFSVYITGALFDGIENIIVNSIKPVPEISDQLNNITETYVYSAEYKSRYVLQPAFGVIKPTTPMCYLKQHWMSTFGIGITHSLSLWLNAGINSAYTCQCYSIEKCSKKEDLKFKSAHSFSKVLNQFSKKVENAFSVIKFRRIKTVMMLQPLVHLFTRSSNLLFVKPHFRSALAHIFQDILKPVEEYDRLKRGYQPAYANISYHIKTLP